MYHNAKAAYAKYHGQLAALVASGKLESEARATLALLGITEPEKPAPSYAELVESADTETAIRWMRAYIGAVVARNADAVPLHMMRRHWSPDHRGAYVSAAVFAEAAKRGAPIEPEKLYTFISAPTPTDAELSESWTRLGKSSRVTIERAARKASAYANPRDDETRLAAPLAVPMTESKPRKRA